MKSNRSHVRDGKASGAVPSKGASAPSPPTSGTAIPRFSRKTAGLLAVVSAVAIGWAYWPTFVDLARVWGKNPQYSHGYLVPLFSLFLLWRGCGGTSSQFGPSWWGIPMLVVGLGAYLAGAYVFFDWLQAVSLLPVLAGVALLIGGWPLLRRAAWPIAFLTFMFPLPFRVETALSQPLQRIATVVSTYALQTVGLPAISEGNVIVINEARIGVVEACNGLGMMLLFFAIATAVALLVDRPLWQKIVLVLSAIPIAVIANVARISVTGMLTGLIGQEWTDWLFHDVAGWFMMPLALLLLWLELAFVSRLFIEVETRTTRLKIGGMPAASGKPEKKTNADLANPAAPGRRVETVESRTAVAAAANNGPTGE